MLRKNWIYAIAFAILYGIEAYFVHGELLAGHGDYRPLIFIPSLVAIIFGPLIGGFVGGFGNLINDIINKYLVEKESLHMGHLVGFIANFIGAYIVGLLAREIRSEEYRHPFSKEALRDYIWNTVAACIGMGAITGLIVGLGLWQIGKVPYDIGIGIAGSIMLWNSLFSFILLIVLPLYVIGETRFEAKARAEEEKLMRLHVIRSTPNDLVSIEDGLIVDGKPVEREWFITSLRIKNLANKEMRYRVEIIGPDIIQPSVKYTKRIKPNDYDDITFSLYPLDSGERHLKLRIIPWTESAHEAKEATKLGQELMYELMYKVKPETSTKLNVITSFLGVLALFAFLFKALFDLLSGGRITGLTVALAFFGAEIVLILLWYMWRRYQLAPMLRK